MDGYSSYINIKFIKFCQLKKIIPICLLPHLTHLLQSLDLVIFLVLKRLYLSKVNKYTACGINSINRDYFLRILDKIRLQVYTRELIISAFKAAGLLPFNPNRALTRYSKQPISIKLLTPLPSYTEATILSSPMHPPLPNSKHT